MTESSTDPAATLLPDDLKPGVATSEFWLTLTGPVLAFCALFGVVDVSAQVKDVLTGVGLLAPIVYNLVRGRVKKAHIDAHATVAAAQATAPTTITAIEPHFAELKSGPPIATADEIAEAVVTVLRRRKLIVAPRPTKSASRR